jgi:uncharacterized protein
MDPAARLLELQAIDLEIDRLRARERALEAGEELAAARGEADAAESELGEHRLRLAAMDRDGARLEHEIDTLRQRSVAEERRLYDGSIANAKELSSLQHEIDSLTRRISDREDELLAMLEQREQVDALMKVAESRSVKVRDLVARVSSDVDEEARHVDAELGSQVASRDALLAVIDPELVELYEDLRRQKKGVGAAALVDGVCQGCHEQLSAVELDRLRRTDAVRRCEHCRRILVVEPQ